MMDYFSLLESQTSSVFYHGTSSEDAAKSIMRQGIKAPDLTNTKNTMLRPVVGKVYATPSLPYAMIYALGGASVFGNKTYQVPYRGNEDLFKRVIKDDGRFKGRYGYIFVMNKTDLQGDIQPDEDSIGEMYHIFLNGGPSQYTSPENTKVYETLRNNGDLNKVMRTLDSIATDNMRRKITDGEYAWYAKLGKRALTHKLFTPEIKKAFVDAGTHVAHEGTIIPSQVWRFDKAKAGWIEEDGSNFFKMAERIR